MLGVARIDSYWQTGDAGRLHDAAARLRGPGAAPFPLRVRQTAEWRAQAERLLNDVDQWSGKSERDERDYFYQKAVLYTWMLDLMPAGPLHAQTLRSFVEFLRRSETDVSRRMLWFAFVNRLLEMTRGSVPNERAGGDGVVASAGARRSTRGWSAWRRSGARERHGAAGIVRRP